jgi:hypothetical protein
MENNNKCKDSKKCEREEWALDWYYFEYCITSESI